METPIAKRTRAAPSPLKGTSPAADRGLVEQADILDRVLPDDDDTVDEDVPPESSDDDDDNVPPPPEETEEAEEEAPAPAAAPARGARRPPHGLLWRRRDRAQVRCDLGEGPGRRGQARRDFLSRCSRLHEQGHV